MFSCKIFERFVKSGKFSSTCHDILGEYSSSKLLSLHSPKRTTILAAELLRISAKCVHVSSVIMHYSLRPLQGAPMNNNPQNFCICKNSHPKRFYISEKNCKFSFVIHCTCRDAIFLSKGIVFYWRSLYISLFTVQSKHDVAFYKQSEDMFTVRRYVHRQITSRDIQCCMQVQGSHVPPTTV